uniref:Pdi3 n=1 Tax=Arundo donax TaxID=35708 RepID=A0A0A9CEU2_ARUDO
MLLPLISLCGMDGFTLLPHSNTAKYCFLSFLVPSSYSHLPPFQIQLKILQFNNVDCVISTYQIAPCFLYYSCV